MTPMTLLFLALAATVSGPARTGPEATVPPGPAPAAESIYFGRVFPLKGNAGKPTYVYERRVEKREAALVSTHITRDPSGAVILADSATHSPDYALQTYALLQNQLGHSGTIRVDKETIRFELFDGAKHRSRVEKRKGAVVVTGPTLVGHVFQQLDALRAGKSLEVRFAILDRLETIGFELRAAPAQPGQTRVRMRPSSFILAAVIDPIDFTFETASGKLVRLEGRVPPKVRAGDRWRDFDARVEYQFVAATYR
jgi:hypothetical protein